MVVHVRKSPQPSAALKPFKSHTLHAPSLGPPSDLYKGHGSGQVGSTSAPMRAHTHRLHTHTHTYPHPETRTAWYHVPWPPTSDMQSWGHTARMLTRRAGSLFWGPLYLPHRQHQPLVVASRRRGKRRAANPLLLNPPQPTPSNNTEAHSSRTSGTRTASRTLIIPSSLDRCCVVTKQWPCPGGRSRPSNPKAIGYPTDLLRPLLLLLQVPNTYATPPFVATVPPRFPRRHYGPAALLVAGPAGLGQAL